MRKLEFSQIAGMNEHFVLQTFSSFLDCMAENGIQNIELWAGLPHLYAFDATPEKVRAIKEEVRARELSIVCYTPEQCVYPFNIAAREPEIREYSIKYFLENIAIAGELGVGMMQLVPGWGYRNEPRKEALKRSMDSLYRILEAAWRRNITVVLEQLEDEESNLIRTSKELSQVLKQMGEEGLQAVIDTCPMAEAGEDFDSCFENLGTGLRHVHFMDRNHLSWGDGGLPMKAYIEQLERHEYGGWLTLEILNERYVREPEKAAIQSIRAVREALLQTGGG